MSKWSSFDNTKGRRVKRKEGLTFSSAYLRNAYPRGLPFRGPDLWKR